MSDEPIDRGAHPILTVEELEALLRSPPRPEARETSAGGLHALVVSRRADDLESIPGALKEAGLDVSTARNPFTALDYLRAREFRALIADYALWSTRGSLIFDRIAQLGRPVDVVFVCDRDPVAVERARATPALAVLERPIDPAAVHDVVARLGSPPMPVVEHEPAGERVAPPPAPPEQPARTDDSANEFWYRFFFEARREARASASAAERWNRLLDLLLVSRGGGAAALIDVTTGAEGRPALKVAHVRATLAQRDRTPEARERLRGRLQHGVARMRECLLAGQPVESAAGNGLLVVPVTADDPPRRLLVSVGPAGSESIALPDAVRDEFSYLAREIDGGPGVS